MTYFFKLSNLGDPVLQTLNNCVYDVMVGSQPPLSLFNGGSRETLTASYPYFFHERKHEAELRNSFYPPV